MSEAFDLYSGTYVKLSEPKAQAPNIGSVATMYEHDRLLAEKGYEAVAEIVEGTGVAPRARYFDTMDAFRMLRDPQRETAIEMRERFLSINPAIEAWTKSMREAMDKQVMYLALYGSPPMFITFDEASELKQPEYKWPSKLTSHWAEYEPAPLTLRERERAHIKTLNGGDQPWKRSKK